MTKVDTDEVLRGIQIVDCDTHFTEPPDLWSSRVPASMRDRVPVQKTVNGHSSWYLHDQSWASIGGNTISHGGQKHLGTLMIQPFEEVDPSSWSVKERLELMDRTGVYAAVVYPNGVGFASNHVFAIEDEAERTLVLQTFNDFYVDIQHESGGRLLPQALLPVWDMDLCVKEMTRLLDKGMRGFTLSDRPELVGLPELSDPYFAPMWEIFNESGAVANFHIGAGRSRDEMEKTRGLMEMNAEQERARKAVVNGQASPAWTMFGKQRNLAVLATQAYMSNVRIIVNLCMSDLFDRYPKLNVVSAESGIGWVPFILEAMEFQLDEMVAESPEVTLQKRRPTEYFRDHLYVMFWFERSGPERLLDVIGDRRVLVETDVPHPTCLYPNPREHFANVLANVSYETRKRVLQDNAAALYKIAVPGASA